MSDLLETYVLDANVFIQAHRNLFPFDICPGYWEALCWHKNSRRVCSIEKIQVELEQGQVDGRPDELWSWVQTSFGLDGFQSSAAAAQVYGEMAAWVDAQSYTLPAKNKFMTVADGWLSAYARVTGKTLVTLEVPGNGTLKKVQLPDVCQAFGVNWITPREMLKRLKVEFTWAPPSSAHS